MSYTNIIFMLFALSYQAEKSYLIKTILAADCPKCKAGYYSDKTGSVKCKPCGKGTQTNEGGSKVCKLCPIGTHMDNEAAVVCEKCKKGTQQDKEGTAKCSDCDMGTYQDENGQTSCKKCTAGTYMPSKGSDQESDCIKCPKGNKCSTKGLKAPEDCPKGTQQDGTGKSNCKKCRAGTQNDIIEQTKCKECPVGTFGPKMGGILATDSCLKCKPGTQNDGKGESSCDECPKNSISTTQGATKCTPCNKGYHTNSTGETKCIPCAEGTSAEKEANRSVIKPLPKKVTFTLNIATSTAGQANTNGKIYVKFVVNNKWTPEQVFLNKARRGEVKSKEFTLENYPTKLSIKTYQNDGYSYWKIWISGNDHWKNNNIILLNKNGRKGTSYGKNKFWVDGDQHAGREKVFKIDNDEQIGCFKDKSKRALPIRKSGWLTPDTCKIACKGSKYYGLQYQGQCFCGNSESYKKYGKSQCKTKCKKDKSLSCGGVWANDVYKVFNIP